MHGIIGIIGLILILISVGMIILFVIKSILERKKERSVRKKFTKKICLFSVTLFFGILLNNIGMVPEREKHAANAAIKRQESIEKEAKRIEEWRQELKPRKERENAFANRLQSKWDYYGEVTVDPEYDSFYLNPHNSNIVYNDLYFAIQDEPIPVFWNDHINLAIDFYNDVNIGLEAEDRNYNITILNPTEDEFSKLIEVRDGEITFDLRNLILKNKSK